MKDEGAWDGPAGLATHYLWAILPSAALLERLSNFKTHNLEIWQ
jgi:hypothetical protein